VRVCHQIKEGLLYAPNQKLDLDAENPINLVHIECFTPEETLKCVQALVSKIIPEKYSFDPIDHIQVISPVNTAGPLSCKSINTVLRSVLNPPPKESGMFQGQDNDDQEDDSDGKFRPGDKVINTKNDKATDTDGKESAIVNGDIGIVKSVSSKEIIVLFSDPPREVVIPKKSHNLKLAYCITCHKFQGSEAPVIIIPVCNQFNLFLSNAWIYTAISRAKIICVTVGTFGTIERAIRNRVPNLRLTRLKERLKKVESEIFASEFEGI
jgi:exodeoxyribonuclease V alpha subunit